MESRPAAAAAPRGKAESGGDAKAQKQIAVLTEQLQDKKKDNKDLQAKIQQLQDDVKKAKSETSVDVSCIFLKLATPMNLASLETSRKC